VEIRRNPIKTSAKSMKSTLAVLLFGTLSSGSLFAATGVFGSYIQIFTTTNTVYKGESFGSVANIQGANFGTFNLTDTLSLTQSQVNTFKNGGGNVTGSEMQYRVYLTSGSPGSFNVVTHSFQSDATFTNLAGSTVTGGGDQAWGNTTPINLLGLTSGNGNYTLEVFFRAFTNEGDRYSNNGGSNFKANFTVIPEPSAALLGGLGMLALLRRRR
jgi:hypothetical protein